jgi:hypothetical protein
MPTRQFKQAGIDTFWVAALARPRIAVDPLFDRFENIPAPGAEPWIRNLYGFRRMRGQFFVPSLSGELASNPFPQMIKDKGRVALMCPSIDG